MLDYDADADGEIDVDADGVPVQPTVTFSLNSSGEFIKPPEWTGRRSSPGRIQTAISDRLSARIELKGAADSYAAVLSCMKDLLRVYLTQVDARTKSVSLTEDVQRESNGLQSGILAANLIAKASEIARDLTGDGGDAVAEALPLSAGVSSDVTSAARAAAKTVGTVAATILGITEVIALSTAEGLQLVIDVLQRELEIDLEEQAWTAENRQLIRDLQVELAGFRDKRVAFDVALRRFDQAQRDLTALIAEGFTVQRTRETFRKRAAAIIQGFRTRDLAFRVFRNEALEKYKTLFDLASRYTFLAARAYDYETGLLDSSGSSAAAAFFDGIVRSRALGVVDSDGNPQFTASTTGDPGLAGVLAQMQGDWAVAKTRLGFNNPDRYRTLFSLREENYRIIPGEEGDQTWRDRLAASRMDNVLDDPDVRRYALQIADDEGLPVARPGHLLRHHHRPRIQLLRPTAGGRRPWVQPDFIRHQDPRFRDRLRRLHRYGFADFQWWHTRRHRRAIPGRPGRGIPRSAGLERDTFYLPHPDRGRLDALTAPGRHLDGAQLGGRRPGDPPAFQHREHRFLNQQRIYLQRLVERGTLRDPQAPGLPGRAQRDGVQQRPGIYQQPPHRPLRLEQPMENHHSGQHAPQQPGCRAADLYGYCQGYRTVLRDLLLLGELGIGVML